MAYPMAGFSQVCPMTLLLAWRMKDMLSEMCDFCMAHGVMPRHETLEEAHFACAEHDTDVNGQWVSCSKHAVCCHIRLCPPAIWPICGKVRQGLHSQAS